MTRDNAVTSDPCSACHAQLMQPRTLTDGLFFGVGFWLAGVIVIAAALGVFYVLTHQHP